jgi:hypothetical protein
MNVQETYKTFSSLLRVREMVTSMVIARKVNSLRLGTSSIGIALKNACIERDADAEIARMHRTMDVSARAFCRAPAATDILVSFIALLLIETRVARQVLLNPINLYGIPCILFVGPTDRQPTA